MLIREEIDCFIILFTALTDLGLFMHVLCKNAGKIRDLLRGISSNFIFLPTGSIIVASKMSY